MSDVTQILSKIESGDSQASEMLLPLVYDALRDLAQKRMAHESPDHTLQATALVHEAYVRLVDVDRAQKWNSRGHFFAAAAEAMRRIVVDHARHKQAIKRGGGVDREALNDAMLANELTDDMVELDDALSRLAESDEQAAELVKLHVFAGRTIAEAAEFIGISERTAARRWSFARAWLIRQMSADG
jgi:RNA polymerase sigma factor (TIGR02999 family)